MNHSKALFLTLPLTLGFGLTSCTSPSRAGQDLDGVYADPNNPYAVPGVSTEGGYAPVDQASTYNPASYQPISADNVNIPVTTPNPSYTPIPSAPSRPSSSPSPSRSSSSSSSGGTRSHTVSAGDTLFGLSRQYGVSVDAIRQANGLTGDIIRTGESLSIPR